MRSGSTVLLTAMSVMEPALHPARAAAFAIRSRTAATLAWIDIKETINHSVASHNQNLFTAEQRAATKTPTTETRRHGDLERKPKIAANDANSANLRESEDRVERRKDPQILCGLG